MGLSGMKSISESDYRALREWFKTTLDQRRVYHGDEPFSYDNRSDYDYTYYRLLGEARDYWQSRYGYAPSDEAMSRAFFDAEIQRMQKARDRRHPLRALWRRIRNRRTDDDFKTAF